MTVNVSREDGEDDGVSNALKAILTLARFYEPNDAMNALLAAMVVFGKSFDIPKEVLLKTINEEVERNWDKVHVTVTHHGPHLQ